MNIPLNKFLPLTNDIIFIDGLWGSGKSVLGPIVNGMERVEMFKLEMIYEYISIMRHLNQITPEAATFFLQSYADDSQYSNSIGRHINLRWGDQSGFMNNPKKIRTISRLFGGEGEYKINEINKDNIALHIMPHMIMLAPDPIFEAYGERLKLIEIVRHPLYMVKHWFYYLERFESTKELTVSINHKGEKVPWFALEWADEFVEANLMDRVLISLIKLSLWLDESIQKTIAKGHKILVLNFESLVLSPQEPLEKLGDFLGRSHHPNLRSIMRKEKIPRLQISQGKGFASYGWKQNKKESEAEAYAQNLAFVKAKGSSEYINNFMDLIADYNKKHPSSLSNYQ